MRTDRMAFRAFLLIGGMAVHLMLCTQAASGQERTKGPLEGLTARELVRLFDETDYPPARSAIVRELLKKRTDAIGVLRQAVAEGTQKQKLLGLELLADMRDDEAGKLALTSLKDPDVKIQRRAAGALFRLRLAAAYEPLLTLLAETRDQGVTKSVLAALGTIGNREAIPVLRKFLVHENASVRVNAAISLAALGTMEGLGVLLAARESDDLQAQREATFGLGYFADPRARSLAERIAADPDAPWRNEAHIALAQQDLFAAPVENRALMLEALCRHPVGSVRLWAVDALAEMGSPRAMSALRAIGDKPTPEGRRAAMKVLAAGVPGQRD